MKENKRRKRKGEEIDKEEEGQGEGEVVHLDYGDHQLGIEEERVTQTSEPDPDPEGEEGELEELELPPTTLRARQTSLGTIAWTSEGGLAVTSAFKFYQYYPTELGVRQLPYLQYQSLSPPEVTKVSPLCQIENLYQIILTTWSPRPLYGMAGRSLLLVLCSPEGTFLYGPSFQLSSAAPLVKVFDFKPCLKLLYLSRQFHCPQGEFFNINVGAWSEMVTDGPHGLLAFGHATGLITIWRVSHSAVTFLTTIDPPTPPSPIYSPITALQFSPWSHRLCWLTVARSCGRVSVHPIRNSHHGHDTNPEDRPLSFLNDSIHDDTNNGLHVDPSLPLLDDDRLLVSTMNWQGRPDGSSWLAIAKPTQLYVCELTPSLPPLVVVQPCHSFPIVGLLWIAGGTYLHTMDLEGTYEAYEVIRDQTTLSLQSLHHHPALAILKDGIRAHLAKASQLHAHREEEEDDEEETTTIATGNQFFRIHGAAASPNGFQIGIHYSAFSGLMGYSIPSNETNYFLVHDLTPFLLAMPTRPLQGDEDLLEVIPKDTVFLYHTLLKRLPSLDQNPHLSLDTLLWDLLPTHVDLNVPTTPLLTFVDTILDLETWAWKSLEKLTLAVGLSRVVVYLYHRIRKLPPPQTSSSSLTRLQSRSQRSFATLMVLHLKLVQSAVATFAGTTHSAPFSSDEIHTGLDQIQYHLTRTLSQLQGILASLPVPGDRQWEYAHEHATRLATQLPSYANPPALPPCPTCHHDLPFTHFLHVTCPSPHPAPHPWPRCQITYHPLPSPVPLTCPNCHLALAASLPTPSHRLTRAFLLHFFTLPPPPTPGVRAGWRCPHCYALLF